MDMETRIEGERSMMELPEGCIANILSRTTPVDACRLSLVFKAFCSAAESDTVWDRFLPSDLVPIISNSQSASSLVATSPSKKSLYLTLSDHPLIIDNGKKSFQLEKRTGKKCYMLSARDLSIIWGGDSRYWDWTTLLESRFQEVARLLIVWWFDISGKINTLALSSDTQYAVFLVFKMMDAHGFDSNPATLSVGILGGHSCNKNVCLDPDLEESHLDDRFQGLERPKVRCDGLLEIEMGEFFNSRPGDEVQMRVAETNCNWCKSGFFLEGIEIRPKN